MTEIDYEQLLHKYIYHVSRNNRGRAFVGPGYSMEGFSPEEIHAIQRAFYGAGRDFDLMTEMDLGGDSEAMPEY